MPPLAASQLTEARCRSEKTWIVLPFLAVFYFCLVSVVASGQEVTGSVPDTSTTDAIAVASAIRLGIPVGTDLASSTANGLSMTRES